MLPTEHCQKEAAAGPFIHSCVSPAVMFSQAAVRAIFALRLRDGGMEWDEKTRNYSTM